MSASHHVFVSYSHDSPQHREAVLALVEQLRADGIDAWIDRFELAPASGWARWARDQMEGAGFVLLVCTRGYQQAFYGRVIGEQGHGAVWEGGILNAEIYRDHGQTARLVPVVLSEEDRRWVPDVLATHSLFTLPGDYSKLVQKLTATMSIKPGELGPSRRGVRAVDPLWQDERDRHVVEVPAWFDGVVYQRAIVLSRSSKAERWTMEVLKDLPLLPTEDRAPRGGALLNLVNKSQHVGSLMALAPIEILSIAKTGTEVREGDTVAVVRGPVREILTVWNQVRSTCLGYLQHAPPLGYRVWTRFVGEPEKSIRLRDVRLLSEGSPTRLAVCLEPMWVPPGLFQFRSPISGRVDLRTDFPQHLQKGDCVASVANVHLHLDLSCYFEGDVRKIQVHSGEQVTVGQVLFDGILDLLEIRTVIVGTFYRSRGPGQPPLVEVGDKVSYGQVLYIVEALKLINEIESPVTGTVVEFLVQNAEPVEFNQVVMRIDCR